MCTYARHVCIHPTGVGKRTCARIVNAPNTKLRMYTYIYIYIYIYIYTLRIKNQLKFLICAMVLCVCRKRALQNAGVTFCALLCDCAKRRYVCTIVDSQYVCMYACMYVYICICTCIHTRMHACIHTYKLAQRDIMCI